jgi:hypothetical protein
LSNPGTVSTTFYSLRDLKMVQYIVVLVLAGFYVLV